MPITTVKFIGGLLDGQTKEITDMDQARGYILLRIPIRSQEEASTTPPRAYEPIRHYDVCYRRLVLCDMEVWAAEYMRPPQIVELLLERYARK